jgi:hypothetical protein
MLPPQSILRPTGTFNQTLALRANRADRLRQPSIITEAGDRIGTARFRASEFYLCTSLLGNAIR